MNYVNYPEPPIHKVQHTEGRVGYQTTGDTDIFWKLGTSGLKVERIGTIRAMTFDNRFELYLDAHGETGTVQHENYNHVLNLLLITAGEI